MPEPSYHNGHGRPVRWSGGQVTVVLPEQVGEPNAGPVGEQLLAVLGRGATVLIADMTATHSCDHAGTGVLARVYQRAVAQGTELRLVIPAPAVRRAIAMSGLDQLVPVFSALAAAQPTPPAAVVLPLPPRPPGNGSAAPASPDGWRPVTWLPVVNPGLNGSARAAQQDIRQREFEDALDRITGGIFEAGLTLQAALGQPADGLRQAAEDTLDLLDETVREARDAAFASHRHAAHGLADAGEPGTAARLSVPVSPVSQQALAGDLVRRSQRRVLHARQIRAQSQQARARAVELTVLSAARQDRIAAALHRAASQPEVHPSIVAKLGALSQIAASRAAHARQWAHDRAATG